VCVCVCVCVCVYERGTGTFSYIMVVFLLGFAVARYRQSWRVGQYGGLVDD